MVTRMINRPPYSHTSQTIQTASFFYCIKITLMLGFTMSVGVPPMGCQDPCLCAAYMA